MGRIELIGSTTKISTQWPPKDTISQNGYIYTTTKTWFVSTYHESVHRSDVGIQMKRSVQATVQRPKTECTLSPTRIEY